MPKRPRCHGTAKKYRTVPFRGIELNISEDAFVCPVCQLTAGIVKSAGKIQQTIADTYRKQTGLLTGEEIKRLRHDKGMTQADLAAVSGFGVASIKRWETGAIQTQSADKTLRLLLLDKCIEDTMTGNRDLSIPRIKLVACAFESELGRAILIAGDKMLLSPSICGMRTCWPKKY